MQYADIAEYNYKSHFMILHYDFTFSGFNAPQLRCDYDMTNAIFAYAYRTRS